MGYQPGLKHALGGAQRLAHGETPVDAAVPTALVPAQAVRANPSMAGSKPHRSVPIYCFIVSIRAAGSEALESYWIDARTETTAISRALRCAGASRADVVAIERQGWTANP